MTRALKTTMTIYGTTGSLFGVSYLLLPRLMSELQGAEDSSAFLVATKMALGASLVPVGVFLLIASRDPIKNIVWVRFAIMFSLLFLGVSLYSGFVLFTHFSQAWFGVTLHGVFAGLLLALYPWKSIRDGDRLGGPRRPGL